MEEKRNITREISKSTFLKYMSGAIFLNSRSSKILGWIWDPELYIQTEREREREMEASMGIIYRP